MLGQDPVFVVLLKEEFLWVEECSQLEVFALAKLHDAGICGVFTEMHVAEELIVRLRTEQQRLWKAS